MKELKQYIYEGILGMVDLDDDNMTGMNDEFVDDINKEKVFNWISKNFTCSLEDLSFHNGIVDCIGDVYLNADADIPALSNEYFTWGKVKGEFICAHNKHLKSLQGAPRIIGELFKVVGCLKLTSLKGGPEEVAEYHIIRNINLTDTTGMAKKVKKSICLANCGIKELVDMPKSVKNLDISNNRYLKSLKGCPQSVSQEFDCSGCAALTSLKGGPKKVGKIYDCSDCYNLETLEGAPKKVNEFNISNCESLETLKGCPSEVHHIIADGCDELESLEGSPEKVDIFSIERSINLTSLKGCPKEIKTLIMRGSGLSDVSIVPEKVGMVDACDIKSIADKSKIMDAFTHADNVFV